MRFHKTIPLLGIAAFACVLAYVVSLAYGAATGGDPPNVGMIGFGSGAVLCGFVAAALFAIDVIQSD